MNDDRSENAMGPAASVGPDLSRRDFAGVSAAALFSLFAGGNGKESVFGSLMGAAAPQLGGEMVSHTTEHLAGGGTKATYETRLSNMPGAGWSGTMKSTFITQPTADGDFIEREISFGPTPLPTADGHAEVSRVRLRADFRHGPVKGNYREDTMTLAISIDDAACPTIVRQVERPLSETGPMDGLTPKEGIQRAIAMARENGGRLPHEKMGGMRIIDLNPEELMGKKS
jgi:hypothetical protein